MWGSGGGRGFWGGWRSGVHRPRNRRIHRLLQLEAHCIGNYVGDTDVSFGGS